MAITNITLETQPYSANTPWTTYRLVEGGLISGAAFGVEAAINAVDPVEGRVFQIDGTLIYDGFGLYVGSGDVASPATTVTIGKTGLVKGDNFALVLYGNSHRVANHGVIAAKDPGAGVGIQVWGDNARIENTGDIMGVIGITTQGTGSHINNSGSIITTSWGIGLNSGAGVGGVVINSGFVTSDTHAVLTGSGNDRIINSGTLNGDVQMGKGDDTFVSKRGMVNGIIIGGEGNDLFVFDRASLRLAELAGEAGGHDTLRSSVAVEYLAVDSGLEDIILTGKRNIDAVGTDFTNAITGNVRNNRLFGLAGDDTLNGGKGNDRLTGGTGSDTLTGGAGIDTFVFSLDGSQDRIVDFEDGIDKIDISLLAGITDIRDLKKNHLAVDGANLVITDGATSIVIENAARGAITADDFLFAG